MKGCSMEDRAPATWTDPPGPGFHDILGEAIKPSNSCVTFLLSFVRRLFVAAESAVRRIL